MTPSPTRGSGGRPASTAPQPDRFLHIYNFVRPAGPAVNATSEDPDVRLLGRCAPPPLDRDVGFSGMIRCRMTTRSPLFVADSEEVRSEPAGRGKHLSYRFFRNTSGRPEVPGSSLRGAVRAVFEAATNSCWEFVADSKLSRRMNADEARGLVPGRILHDADDDTWWFEQLTGTSGFDAETDPHARGEPLYAAWVLRGYSWQGPAEPQRVGLTYSNRVPLSAKLQHGGEYRARIAEVQHRAGFRIWVVTDIAESAGDLKGPRTPEQREVRGYYFHTNFNFPKKHDERFFFYDDPIEPDPESIEIPADGVDRFVELLRQYRERYREDRKAGRGPGGRLEPSRFLTESVPAKRDECNGQLAYAWFDEHEHLKALLPVAVSRVLYHNSIRDRMPADDAVARCSDRSQPAHPPGLCPACRTFGWVHDGAASERDRRGGGAYRSRVRFSAVPFGAGDLISPDGEGGLPILSAPKPTTGRFYLMPEVAPDTPVPERDADKVGYDGPNVLRGRKFYRGRTPARHDEQRSSQNRTLREHLRPESISELFDIHFENLAAVELGALLWSLKLDGDMVHRIGFAKPLGYGAATIAIDEVVIDTGDSSAGPETRRTLEANDREGLIGAFRSAMTRRYGAARFDDLANIRDLRALLAGAVPPGGAQYPELRPAHNRGTESFRWFVANTRGAGHLLPYADSDVGLPFDPSR